MALRAPENDPEVPEMNEAATQPIRRSVQLAVLRTPTSSLLEAVAEARRRPDSVGLGSGVAVGDGDASPTVGSVGFRLDTKRPMTRAATIVPMTAAIDTRESRSVGIRSAGTMRVSPCRRTTPQERQT
jgi:hypothetical protein